MSYAPTRVERENGEITKIFFDCERRELRNIVDDIEKEIIKLEEITKAKPIRREDFNPVIKTNRSDMIYFRWTESGAVANVKMAKEPVDDVVVAYFMSQDNGGDEDPFPWDREEMSEFAREKIEEMREGEQFGDEATAWDDEERERRRRAREESDQRSDYQREPRGGTERRGQDQAEIVDGKTQFLPPYEKDEVDYYGPGQGEHEHYNCEDCVHYIEGGGCHMVRGEVEPEGHCEDLFADFGIFARIYESEFQVNLALWGEMFEDRFGNVSFQEVADRVKAAIRRKL